MGYSLLCLAIDLFLIVCLSGWLMSGSEAIRNADDRAACTVVEGSNLMQR